MVWRVILLFLSVLFGVLIYMNSDKVFVKQFVVIEKVKDDNLYLKYKEKNKEQLFEVTSEQYINTEVGEEFIVSSRQTDFYVYCVLCGICISILFISIGIDISDLLDVIT